MSQFILHSQLEADSIWVCDLPLCQLRLHNQKTVPWLILVPRRPDITEIYQLNLVERAALMEEISLASKALTTLYAPDKINIAALGNMVAQLHVHVIARYKTDEAWPNPIWGRITPEQYPTEAIDVILKKLKNALII
ncbi:MAG: HIT family protein [Alphaproteobacteria bacterium]